MKKKILLLIPAAVLCWLTVTVVVSCAKSEESAPAASGSDVALRSEENEIPEEVAQYLTEAEIAAFWASKPTEEPPSGKEKGEKRPKKWRPFFAWGETIGRSLPVLSNCTDFANAEICYSHEDCPNVSLGPPLVPPFVGYVTGEGHMSGYGKVTQVWKRFVCSSTVARLNGTYIKDEDNRLHWRSYSSPSFAVRNGLYMTTLKIKVCNASLPLDEQCWDISTGDFNNSEGIVNYRVITTWPFTTFYPMFVPAPAYRIAWGWMWY